MMNTPLKKLLPILALILTHSVFGQIQSPPSSIELQIQTLEQKQDSLRYVISKIEVESALEALNSQYQNEGIESPESVQKLKRLIAELERTLDYRNRNMSNVNSYTSPPISNRAAMGSLSNPSYSSGGASRSGADFERTGNGEIGIGNNGQLGNNGQYWMNGRPVKIPEPEVGCNYAGVVVIKIAVNANGEVYEAELAPNNQIPAGLVKSNFGSNTCLVYKAKRAAVASKWSADPGNLRRVGFIVYRFDLQ